MILKLKLFIGKLMLNIATKAATTKLGKLVINALAKTSRHVIDLSHITCTKIDLTEISHKYDNHVKLDIFETLNIITVKISYRNNNKTDWIHDNIMQFTTDPNKTGINNIKIYKGDSIYAQFLKDVRNTIRILDRNLYTCINLGCNNE